MPDPTYGPHYDYEWMNAGHEFGEFASEMAPLIKEFGTMFGLIPQQPQSPEPQTIVVQPKPWYESLQSLPPWLLGAAAGLGVLIVFKALE